MRANSIKKLQVTGVAINMQNAIFEPLILRAFALVKNIPL